MNKKSIGYLAAILAVAGTLGAATAFAADTATLEEGRQPKGEHPRHEMMQEAREEVLASFGISVEEFQEAMQAKMQAKATEHLAERVAAGEITQEQADKHLERMEERLEEGKPLMRHGRHKPGGQRPGFGPQEQ